MSGRLEWIDSHCHLHYDYAPKSAQDLIKEAEQNGVSTLITVGTDIPTLPVLVALSEAHPTVYHTAGVHPHEAESVRPDDLKTLEQAAKHPKCRAIGEIGLDYYYDHSPHDVQIMQLKAQLELAETVKLPVVIHSRDAEDDLLAALTAYRKRLPEGRIPGVIHCFTGTRKFGEACLALGFYISFSGILTFKNSEDLRESARAFPLDRLLVETDSPYLAPMPMRGKKCEPWMVRHTGEKLAEVKGLAVEEVAAQTTRNTRKVFGL